MSFTPDRLSQELGLALQDFPGPEGKPARYQLAFSGGLDSHVLLHSLCQLRHQLGDVPIHALHVDHGLHPDAADWSAHCQSVCDALEVPLHVIAVDARAGQGESPEAAARDARYQALAANLEAGDVLLTAQHQDDQLETLLLQLMRGAGPRGLAAMPLQRRLGAGIQLRPLLGFSRDELLEYARQQGLQWCEDPSNASEDYDRNFLRHQVVPVLKRRWPAAAPTASRSARLCAQAAQVLDDRACADLQVARSGRDQVLNIPAILQLDKVRQSELLRCWFRQLQVQAPSEALLGRLLNEVLTAREDAQPLVEWGGHSVRRYRQQLHLVFAVPNAADNWECLWSSGDEIALPGNLGKLRWIGARRPAISLRVLPRAGGERFTQRGRRHSHSLKKLLQQEAMPPWLRVGMPLVYSGDTLLAVPGIGFSAEQGAMPGEIIWIDPEQKPWWRQDIKEW